MKNRATIIYGLKCLQDSGATNIMIKRRQTRPHGCIMCYKKVEYSTYKFPYYTAKHFKVPLFMPEFSIRNIISHRFYVDNDEGESGIGYDMVIGRGLMA